MYMTSESLKDLLRGAIDHHRDNRDTDAIALAAIVQGYALVSIAESLSKIDTLLERLDDSNHHLALIAVSTAKLATAINPGYTEIAVPTIAVSVQK